MPTKLTKAEQTLRTRRAILVRARHLFATKGYAATGTEEIISELGITRGALYHQFNDKLGVFKAVIAEAYGEITGYIRSKIQPLDNNWEQLVIGCQAFLEIAQQEELRRLVFIEAPAVLAADTLVEFDQYGFGLLYEAIQIAVKEGKLNTIDVEGFAHLVNGSLNELAAWVAQSNDPKRLKTAQQLIETLLTRHQV
ncbi:MAG: TetR/AcrR family transcriptional regulator [Microcoleus sp. PH2017_15_JOR_U_A]|nr:MULTISPECIES: TetR/AcrR family transcriptional regulator [unclassified Microcoleus]MCC3470097.1 TetR/AcrR family transcriptional regulator [Microcoleus sp. PH2017_06_SFM_O_A]MCC3500920.1 TetR/AcrR family transcriptional regulator [Microcoleus sp. PH2017_15_JOR_U_A]TAE62396.1 MAG: TetR/AcrR family transcriptional regulator [Oscillatoriales cyanobacterium]MCC3476212.1 TetR/AcrR family transcriptional regulator [Microcoleus sp. PH2017_13_LAR_U_A]MCC3626492.1 TetR/AcrR family transcriptional re